MVTLIIDSCCDFVKTSDLTPVVALRLCEERPPWRPLVQCHSYFPGASGTVAHNNINSYINHAC